MSAAHTHPKKTSAPPIKRDENWQAQRTRQHSVATPSTTAAPCRHAIKHDTRNTDTTRGALADRRLCRGGTWMGDIMPRCILPFQSLKFCRRCKLREGK